MFEGLKIGVFDSNGIELKNGDNIKIEIVPPSKFSAGVFHKGIIKYHNGAFCISTERRKGLESLTPICNYAPTCKITKED